MKATLPSLLRFTGICALAADLLGGSARAAAWKVSPTGNDANSGATWDQARRTVGQALAAAKAGDEVWVAAGTYAEHVELKPDVALYGGFAGNETDLAARDWVRHTTVLDGTTNGIVVLISAGGPGTILDGFTIRRGAGAGVRLVNTAAVVRHNVIRDNQSTAALAYGAGVSVKNLATNAVATLERNVIVYNYAYDGGGIACIDASPRILHNVIAWNFARQNGGGISCWRDSSPLIANNVISANTAFTLDGVAVPVGGGGIFATADDLDGRPHPTAMSSPVLRNNVVAANGGWKGGGIALIDSNGGVPQVLNNTIVANNGAGIFWGSAAAPLVALLPVLRNNLVAFNPWGLELAPGTPTNAVIEFNCVIGNRLFDEATDYTGLASRTGRDGNISAGPKLASVEGGDFHLQPDSPCVNAGTNLVGAADWQDIDEQPRVAGGRMDIGADESAGETWSTVLARFHVRPDGDDAADGLSWATARKSLQATIDHAKLRGGEIWVAAGAYREHLIVPAFVHLYGGFAGTETGRAERDPQTRPTVIHGNELPNVVVFQNSGFRVSTLDGFTVTGGGRHTGGAGLNKYGRGGNGGGLHLNLSSPNIRHNLIRSNSLAHDNVTPPPGQASLGAGIYCRTSYPLISSNTIQDNEILNTFDGRGGGIYCERYSQPLIEGNTLRRNQAPYGPAVYSLHSAPVLRGNLIESNAFYNTYPLPLYLGANQGAVTLLQNDSCLIEANTFRGNVAGTGAAIHAAGCPEGRVQNNLILDNRAYDPTSFGGMGGGIYWSVLPGATGTVSIVHNTIAGNVATNLFSEMGGGLAFVLTANPERLVIANNIFASNSSGLYQIPSTPLARPVLARNNLANQRQDYVNLPAGATDLSVPPGFTGNGDWRLRPDSPCLDAGDPLYASAHDLRLVRRPLDGNNDGVAAPDLGAYEMMHSEADSDRDGMPDGWEWEHGLNPVLKDAGDDPDRDGATNLEEFYAGTWPLEPVSVLRLTITPVPGEAAVRLEFFSLSNRVYTVEYSDRLFASPPWPALTNGVSGGDTAFQLLDPAGAAERFYRLRVRPE